MIKIIIKILLISGKQALQIKGELNYVKQKNCVFY